MGKTYKKLYLRTDEYVLQMGFNPSNVTTFRLRIYLFEMACIMHSISCFISSLLSPGKAGSALAELAFLRLVPYAPKPVKKNKKTGNVFGIVKLQLHPDSERREIFEVLIPFIGVRPF